MTVRRLLFSLRHISVLLGLCFVLQTVGFGAMHTFHGDGQHSLSSQAKHQDKKNSSLPEECSCELCLSFRALDSATVSKPPEFALVEAAFTEVAVYLSFSYSHPILFSQARGPPLIS